MTSVIIAAHNEEAVLGSCLTALQAQHVDPPLEIVVSANGCSDRTAQLAKEFGVTVVDRDEPGKPGALNAAELVTTSFPRIYLDADIVVPPDGVQQMVALAARSPGVRAVVPRRRVDSRRRPWAVKAYFAINDRLPVFRDGLFGRGMIMLTEDGRSRFEQFPSMIADDLFLDSLYSSDERVVAVDVEVVVSAPRRTKDLYRRLVRVRRGNVEMRRAATEGQVRANVRPSDRWAWLRDVVLPEPHLTLAAVPYVTITTLASLAARRSSPEWGRDESTRHNGDDSVAA